jgi:hypothetical protein
MGFTDDVSAADQMGEAAEARAIHSSKGFELSEVANRLHYTRIMDDVQEDQFLAGDTNGLHTSYELSKLVPWLGGLEVYTSKRHRIIWQLLAGL